MSDLFTIKLFPVLGFYMLANATGPDLGLWGEVMKNGFLAVCLAGLAFHTKVERDKDRADKKIEAAEDRKERAEERAVMDKVLERNHGMIADLTEKLFQVGKK